MNGSDDLILNSRKKTAFIEKAFERHQQHPEIDLASYRAELRLALGKEVLTKRRIYLDINHWVGLRDVHLQRSQKQTYKNLYEQLEALIREAKIICPVSNPCIIELFKQDDPKSRRATAQVIDKFSHGCVIHNPMELMSLEIHDFAQRHVLTNHGLNDTALKQRVWTKPMYFFGDLPLPSEGFPGAAGLAVQKAQEDLLWSLSLEDFVCSLREGEDVPHTDAIYAMERLNAGKFTNAKASDTFDELFMQEIEGSVKALDFMIEPIRENLLQKSAGATLDVPLSKIIIDSIKTKKIGAELPSLVMYAGMHAAIRCEPARRYKKGDFDDLNHVTVAMPYFDFFLTERSLAHLITTKPLQYDQLYGCTVFSSVDDLIGAFKSL